LPSLDELFAAFAPIAPSISNPPADAVDDINAFDFNFNNVVPFPGADVSRALTQAIPEGGTSDMTRYQGAGVALGHFIRMIREGRYNREEAWQAAKDWNQATMQPPWPEERLRVDWERLLDIDVREKGPLVTPVAILPSAPGDWSIMDWRADRFAGEAPVRRWLIEGLIPQGTPGVFAAVGDAGKSMLALRLALYITSYPAPGPDIDTSSPHFFGQAVVGRGAAVILTAEDDAAEVHRRLNGLDPAHARRGRPLYVVPMISAGGARAILVDGFNGPQPTPFWYELRNQLLAIPDLKLVVLDPLSSFVGADINKDNLAGAALMTLLAELAATSGAAVMLVHHFAKASAPTSLSNARTAIRGAGSLVDNGRWALVLWEAEHDDADAVLKALGQSQRSNQSGIVYFGGLAKGNAPGAKILRTLVRGPSGLLEDVTEAVRAGTLRVGEIDALVHRVLLTEKDRDTRFAFPIGRSSIDRYVVPLLRAAGVGIDLKEAYPAIQRLLGKGMLARLEGKGDKYEPVTPET
jgi:hypothetical protein